MVVRQHADFRPAIAAEDLGREQAVSARAVGQTRRNGSGHRPARVLQPDSRGARVLPRHPDRHAARLSARRLRHAAPDARSGHSDPAPDLAAGVAAARPRPLSEIRAGRAVCDRRVFDVADGAEHDGRSARHPAGLLEHREGASSLAPHDVHEDRICRRRCRRCSPASG